MNPDDIDTRPIRKTAMQEAWDREMEAVKQRCDADDQLMAAAARGGPFWGVGEEPVDPGQLTGLAGWIPVPAPPIERYIRCSIEIPDGSIEMGLEVTSGPASRTTLRQIAIAAYMTARVESQWTNVEGLADAITPILERSMVGIWPDRPWFFEVWSATEALSQVYAPYGMPRRT
jgi:hypothetical protein